MSAAPGFSPIPDLPVMARVMAPTLTVHRAVASAVVEDVDGNDVALRFAPCQGVRVTTIDCFRQPDGLPHHLERLYWAGSSPWIDELRAGLAAVDHGADFMDRVVHFLVPAGDNVLEVVAWEVAIGRPGAEPATWPREIAPQAGSV